MSEVGGAGTADQELRDLLRRIEEARVVDQYNGLCWERKARSTEERLRVARYVLEHPDVTYGHEA